VFSEPINSVVVIGISLVGALHLGGYSPTSKTSPALNWAKEKHPKLPKVMALGLVFVAVVKLIGIL
jgi:hypothetical protein